MPQLVRLYLRSVAIGFGLAAVFSGALIWLDVAGIGHLILGSDIGMIAGLMLLVFNGIVFSAVQFGIVVMGMGEDEGPRGGLGQQAQLVPVRVEATSRRLKG